MLATITDALKGRPDLVGWSVRQILGRGAQLYAVPGGVESQRSVQNERYVIEVLRDTTRPGQAPSTGIGNVTVLPGDDLQRAIDAASLRAGLVYNKPHGLPGPAPLPDVPLADPVLEGDMAALLCQAYEQLRSAAEAEAGVRMTAAELFAERETVTLRNSCGIDATQTETSVAAEWVLLAKGNERESETFVEMTRRRLADLPLAAEMARQARYTTDLLRASAPPDYRGRVVLRDSALTYFMDGQVIQTLASGAAKFGKISTWEVGESIFRGSVTGDALTVWANRQLPYGVGASRFDHEGLPAQRLLLIDRGDLVAFSSGQRYAEYLGLPATGEFGVIEVAPGPSPSVDLLAEPHVEIVAFSWFNPDEVTGDFASEIRLGYVVDGDKRTAFKGGQLIGNYLDALAGAHWSHETGFYGSYMGPTTVRFENLLVAA